MEIPALHHLRFSFFLVILLLSQAGRVLAADGFDNNYVGGDANQLTVTINGVNHAVLFGPGQMSPAGFYIPIPNGMTNDQGNVSTFTLAGAISSLRSAYFDRVLSTSLYYRIYLVSNPMPPAWTTLALQEQVTLLPMTCYTETQLNTWQNLSQSINVLQGLATGSYVLEFYTRSELYDVGVESLSPCLINADQQCDASTVHDGRFISSTFNTTDPTACDLANVLATQSAPTKMFFQITSLPLELTYFQGKLRDKNVLLQWETAQEQDMQDFLVERSPDDLQWLPLTEIAAIGTSTTARTYEFVDRQPRSGPNYYRLKSRSTNDRVDISPTIVLTINGGRADLLVWPNPVRETLYYQLPEGTDEPLVLRIFDLSGRELPVRPSPGAASASLSFEGLGEGLYFLELSDQSGHRVAISRFLKMN